MDARIAEAAGRLLKDDAFREACEETEAHYKSIWGASEFDEKEKREAAYQRLRALVDMLRTLRRMWELGEAEKMAAERKAKAAT